MKATWEIISLMPHAARAIEVALVGHHSIKFYGVPWGYIFKEYAEAKGLDAYFFRPCPDGFYRHPTGMCNDSIEKVQEYQQRIRDQHTDISIEISDPEVDRLFRIFTNDPIPRYEPEDVVFTRVAKAQRVSLPNLQELTRPVQELLRAAISKIPLGLEGVLSVRAVALSIAQLDGVDSLGAAQLAEALQYTYRQ